MAEKKPTPAGVVSVAQLAEVMDCDQRTIQKYAADGIVVRVSYGRYHLLNSVRNLIRHLRKQASLHAGRDSSIDPIAEGAFLKRVQVKIAEAKLRVMQGDLVSKAEVEEAWGALVTTNRQLVMSIASRARQEIPNLTGSDQKVLAGICADILRETALGKGVMPPLRRQEDDE